MKERHIEPGMTQNEIQAWLNMNDYPRNSEASTEELHAWLNEYERRKGELDEFLERTATRAENSIALKKAGKVVGMTAAHTVVSLISLSYLIFGLIMFFGFVLLFLGLLTL